MRLSFESEYAFSFSLPEGLTVQPFVIRKPTKQEEPKQDAIDFREGGHTDGTTQVTSCGFIFDEWGSTSLSENDMTSARLSSKRAKVMLEEGACTRPPHGVNPERPR